LTIWVEGPSDKSLFDHVVVPRLSRKMVSAQVKCWRNLPKATLLRFLAAAVENGEDYLFVADLDTEPCVTAKKRLLQNELEGCLHRSHTVVVVSMIEGWYLAGLDAAGARRLGTKPLHNTDHVTKEDFERLRPSGFQTNREFMLAILDEFSVRAASRKNASFKYFLQKPDC